MLTFLLCISKKCATLESLPFSQIANLTGNANNYLSFDCKIEWVVAEKYASFYFCVDHPVFVE